MTDKINVAGWHGIAFGHISARPTCTNYGWREAEWERDPVLGWIETSATLRPIVGYRVSEMGEWEPVLGEPRTVLEAEARDA